MQLLLLFSLMIPAFAGKSCKNPAKCLVSPCSVFHLPCAEFHPKAKCKDDLCNGCNVKWISKRGKRIICDTCAFPPTCGKIEICFVNPCNGAKKPKCRAKHAKCIPSYCGSCQAIFVDKRTGKKLPQRCDCVDCYGLWTLKIGKKTCKECTCNEIAQMGRWFAKRACKKKYIKAKCCRMCKFL